MTMHDLNNVVPNTLENVDEIEIEKFSNLAHQWWDKQGDFAALHAINPLRLRWVKGFVDLSQAMIVDIGCGGGILTEALANEGALKVLGVDLAEKSLKIAALHALQMQLKNIQYQNISAESLAQSAPGAFDVVTCMEMLEHVPNPQSIVQSCAKLVKPNGWVFFSTINRNPKAFLHVIVGAEYVLNLVPKKTHAYQKFIQPNELIQWARQFGLHPKAATGICYNPLTRRYWLNEGDLSTNYILALQKLN